MNDLFSDILLEKPSQTRCIDHGHGLLQIKGLAPYELCLFHIHKIAAYSPFRKMMTPMGHPMKVSTCNCGEYGWISNERGYQYSPIDPLTKRHWCAIPQEFLQLHRYALQLSNLPSFSPDSCLINRYEVGDAMGLHQDKDEVDTSLPIVSISLGLIAVFQVGGLERNATKKDILLESGDVLILSGHSRGVFHGVKPVKLNPLNPSSIYRYNLTLRKSQ